MTRLKDTQTVDLDGLDYSQLRDAEAYILEVVTPYVLRSEYPATNDVDVPWWWSVDDESQLRHREEKIVEGGDVSGARPSTTDRSPATRAIGRSRRRRMPSRGSVPTRSTASGNSV
jgi:hypothetical protein